MTQEEKKATFPQRRRLWHLTGDAGYFDYEISEAWAGKKIRQLNEARRINKESRNLQKVLQQGETNG